jgi:endoglucanase
VKWPRSPRRAVAVAALASAVAAAVAIRPAREGLKRAARWAVGYPAWRERAGGPREEAFFGRLAASQVGYAPRARKQFTSPSPFASFELVSERDGSVVLRGGPPARAVPTDVLGPVGKVWIGDFSALEAPGRYRVVASNGLASHPFDVGAGVYDAAVRAVQRAFYYQRAFTAIDAAHAEGPWIHASDADRAPPGESRGWHDAGDLSIYSASANSALFWLLQAEADFAPGDDDTNIPESGNGVPDLLDEARWELEWILSVQDPSGGFRNATCQERYGPYGTNAPERAAPYRAGEVGTIATGRAVGTLAFAASLYRAHAPAFAARCLEAALRGQRYLEARPGEASDGPTCPAYRLGGDPRAGREVRMYAAAGLLLATGARRFGELFESGWAGLDGDPRFPRTDAQAALLYLRAPGGDPALQRAIREQLRLRAAELRAEADRHPFHWAGRYFWGSLAAAFHRSAAFSARACLESPARAREDCEQVLDHVHYALGRNSLQLCYVSGLPGVSRGRTRAFHQWLAALGARPFLFPGLLAGGPVASPEPEDTSRAYARPLPVWGYWGDPAMPRDAATPVDGRYTDNDSWSTNEIDVDWQGVALYNLYLARWWARGGAAHRRVAPVVHFPAEAPPR